MARRVGRFLIDDAIASGGMATVHLARLAGPAGFSRTLAVKRLHPGLASDGELGVMLLDEARVTARIQHPFVVQTVDVVAEAGELLIVMEYVHGASLSRLLKRSRDLGRSVDATIVATIMAQVLHGLDAAHEVRDETGTPLGVVHRDVSPQNVMVGADGVARVLDFGIAKALGRAQTTTEGQIKGKLAYMSPEQALGAKVDRRTDVFAAGVVLWELLTQRRLFAAEDQASTFGRVQRCEVPPASSIDPSLDGQIDAILARALAREPDERFATAREMAGALEAWRPTASASRIAAWVDELCHDELAARRKRIVELERTGSDLGLATPDQAQPDDRTAPSGPRAEAESALSAGEPTRSEHSLSLETPPAPRRPRALAVPIAVAGGMVAAALIVYALVGRAPSPAASQAASREVVPTAEAMGGSAKGAAGPAPGPSVVPALASPTAEASASPPAATATPTATARASSPASSRPTAAPTAKPRAKVDCTNPKYLDAEGRTRYRRECLDP